MLFLKIINQKLSQFQSINYFHTLIYIFLNLLSLSMDYITNQKVTTCFIEYYNSANVGKITENTNESNL